MAYNATDEPQPNPEGGWVPYADAVEARAAVLREVRADIAGLAGFHPGEDGSLVMRSSALAAIDRRLEPEHRHEFTMLSSPPTCAVCGAKAPSDPYLWESGT